MKSVLLLLRLLPSSLFAPTALTTIPAEPLIELGEGQQLLNFDVMVKNNTGEELEVSLYEVTVLGPDGELLAQKRLDTNGMSILTLQNRVVKGGQRVVLFNPLHAWDEALELGRIRVDIGLDAGEVSQKYRASLELRPVRYQNHARLILPVVGRVFVHDGHDYYSHHRRLDITGEMTTALGVTTNMTRYAYDFVIVDEQGRMYRGDGEKNEDWYGFGSPILAPAAGRVVASSDGQPDNTRSKKNLEMSLEAFMNNHNLPFGNFVILDHDNGEFSFFAHLKHGSVQVKDGDTVEQGQQIGAMGFSGDAFLVHLHYQLQRDANWGEGLPSYFDDFERVVGGQTVPVKHGQVDSGDVLIAKRR